MSGSSRPVRRGALIAAALIAAAVLAVQLASRTSETSATVHRPGGAPPGPKWGAHALPAPVKPVFTVPTPRPLRASATGSRWAPVERRAAARTRPTASAPVLTMLSTQTPEGTSNLVLVLGRRHPRSGGLWVHVLLPILPNSTSGWVERSALGGYRFLTTRLVVDVRRLRATLYRGRRIVFGAAVAVGAPATPTPRGYFYIRDRLTRYASPFYGPVAFGTSARSPVETDWPNGGFIGIHGTDRPGLIPGRVSHGCIRMRNRDILNLARLMPVGTPVIVR
jgi:hypothetical protein